jgi:hypothetical protein
MRLPVRLLPLLGLFLVAPLSAVEPARKAAPPVPVEQWIERLGSSDFRQREEAARALSALGEQALPALRKAQKHPDPEVRRRLEDLIPSLEAAALLAPKRVTLHVTNRPLKDVIAALSKQTGYKILSTSQDAERDRLVYSFQLDHVPFWEAMQKVCEATGAVLQGTYYGDDVIRLMDQDQFVPFVSNDGAFRVTALNFSYGRNIQFGQLARNQVPAEVRSSEYLYLSISVSVEPRLPLLSVGQVKLTVAEDEQKNSLVPPAVNGIQYGPRFYYGGGYRSFSQHVQTGLAWPSKTAKTLKLVRGIIPVTLLAEQRPSIVVEDILKAKGKKLQGDGTQLDVDEVGEAPKGMVFGNGKAYQVRLSLRDTRPDNPNDYTWVQSLAQRLDLFDAKGNKLTPRGYNWQETTPNSVKGATFTFSAEANGNAQQVGPPAKLVYYTWLKRDHEVNFEFRDLPLP